MCLQAFGKDPAPGVVKTFSVMVWQSGELKKLQFGEGHAAPIHIELGPL